ncbi:histidinol-phosphatase [bacterium]|nr:histidinol-phosphatase [bacterium]
MHTYLTDGKDKHQDFIPFAIEKGISEIGFSDHICLFHPSWGMQLSDIDVMIADITEARNIAGDRIKVRFGIEMDFIEGKEKDIKQIINSLPLDYVIGAIHHIGDFNFDTNITGFKKRDINESIERYYKDLTKMIESGLFDIVAHFDLIKMFGNIGQNNYSELVTDVIKKIKKAEMVVEMNTNGFNKPCKEFYPSIEIIDLCHQYDIPMTLSSDAHKAEQVGQYFNEAVLILKQAGYKEITGFDKRGKYSIPL